MSEHDTPVPYGDTQRHLLDELGRIDLLLRRHVEALWRDPGAQPDRSGFYVSDEEVAHLLTTDPPTDAPTGDGDQDGDREGGSGSDDRLEVKQRAVQRRVSASLDAGVDLRLVALTREFGLTTLELDVLLLALAPDLDRKYERIYGYLRDDITSTRPTVELLRQILGHSAADRLALLDAFATRSPPVAAGLLLVSDGATIPSSTVRVDRRVLEYLLGSDAVADAISDAATVVSPRQVCGDDASIDDLLLEDARRRTLATLADRLGHRPRTDAATDRDRTAPYGSLASDGRGTGRPLMAAFVGPDELTATRAVTAVCAAAGVPVLRVDAHELRDKSLADALSLVRLEARLQHAAIHVTGVDALESGDGPRTDRSSDPRTNRRDRDTSLRSLVDAVDAFLGDVFLTGDADVSARLQPRLTGHDFRVVAFPRPGFEERHMRWERVDGLPSDADPATLAGTYRLTHGEIEDAVATARSLGDGALTGAAIREACRLHSRRDLDDLATEITPTYDWADIVLPPDTLAHLREIAAGIRHRGTVYEEWGFAERFSLGNGINVLFTGPSGTGKTMAAEIIANDVGLPLYKLDIAQILSKYIGETESNLGRVFDAAEHSNAILFFDEADALFGTRTEISDSHDRYANVEVDYLLQRMEEHDGCVILASNLKENIDTAFRRRINATVAFPLPDAAAREELWRTIFPTDVPRDDIDDAFLARFEFSGGFIKNVALTAAFLAAEEDGTLEMAHVVRALRREYQKTGKLLDLDEFGDYRDLVE